MWTGLGIGLMVWANAQRGGPDLRHPIDTHEFDLHVVDDLRCLGVLDASRREHDAGRPAGQGGPSGGPARSCQLVQTTCTVVYVEPDAMTLKGP